MIVNFYIFLIKNKQKIDINIYLHNIYLYLCYSIIKYC